jgi:hypothetical protein
MNIDVEKFIDLLGFEVHPSTVKTVGDLLKECEVKAAGIESYLASLDAEELWDENSELIDDDIPSLETVAGHNVMRKGEFIKLINDLIARAR